ncbi:nitrate/nitrite transporter [Sediminibacterium sp.]|uniref:MFS transporter n=1 Tax=Sediminibacterium sp. TaxID=1917865 RepID=UPI0027326823|nr:MFS transporter [Sediminibacterium sp.]MDP3394033.1 MFS transporter [Sediminibacterium sp.]MDP3566377.1 MFS transporter [Sediminibacterium sp.]
MNRILFIIILAQFFCTSVWFAGNAVMTDMAFAKNLDGLFLVYLTSAVQFGFIIGTLVFAVLAFADRFSPSLVFLFSALLSALFNGCITFNWVNGNSILICRFLTGFFLAGIYPVGMKIAADYFEEGLGKSLGFLVGALVLGTAFPHLIKFLSFSYAWEYIFYATSLLSVFGGLLIFGFVKDGPYRRQLGKINLKVLKEVVQLPLLRRAAFGYFGHMWELYAFWTFVPLMLTLKLKDDIFNIPLLSFIIIGIGSLACAISGLLSVRFGANKMAKVSVAVSAICCLAFPLFFSFASNDVFIVYLMNWGFFVVADSPMFSSMVASNAPAHLRGSILTIVNSFGFFITILSIQLIGQLIQFIHIEFVWLVLAIGPIFAFLQLNNPTNRPKL